MFPPSFFIYSLPAGGRRLVQRAHGYVATIVAGLVTQRDGEPTGALPGATDLAVVRDSDADVEVRYLRIIKRGRANPGTR